MFIRTCFRWVGLSLVTIFSIVLLTISYFSLMEIISGTPSLSAVIPETQSLVRYPFTWHIVSRAHIPENHIRIQPWLDRNEIIGAEVRFAKDCTLTMDNGDCDPVKEIEKWQADMRKSQKQGVSQVELGIMGQIDSQNSEIYYVDFSRIQFIKTVRGRAYFIKIKQNIFSVHTLKPSIKYLDEFNATTDKIALSIEP